MGSFMAEVSETLRVPASVQGAIDKVLGTLDPVVSVKHMP